MNLRLLLASSLIGVSLAACNSGGSTPAPLASPTASPSSTTAPVTVPASIGGTQTVISASSLPAFVTSAGITGIGFTAPNGVSIPAGTISGTPSTTLPSTITSFAAAREKQSYPGTSVVFFYPFTVGATVNLNPGSTAASFDFRVGVGSVPSGVNYYIAGYNGVGWDYTLSGPATVVTDATLGESLDFPVSVPAGFALSTGTQYALALYTLPSSLSDSGTVTTSTSSQSLSGTVLSGNQITLSVPAATSGGALLYSDSLTAPTGVPTLAGNGLAYVKLTPQSTIAFASGSTISGTYTLASGNIPATSAYKLAVYDGAAWHYNVGSISISGATATYSYTSTAALSLSANTNYYIAVYH